MNTWFGVSANTYSPAPEVQFARPGSWLIGFGQLGTISYAPNGSWPPFSVGTAANPVFRACPCSGVDWLPIAMPIASAAATAAIIETRIRVLWLLLGLSNSTSGGRGQV